MRKIISFVVPSPLNLIPCSKKSATRSRIVRNYHKSHLFKGIFYLRVRFSCDSNQRGERTPFVRMYEQNDWSMYYIDIAIAPLSSPGMDSNSSRSRQRSKVYPLHRMQIIQRSLERVHIVGNRCVSCNFCSENLFHIGLFLVTDLF